MVGQQLPFVKKKRSGNDEPTLAAYDANSNQRLKSMVEKQLAEANNLSHCSNNNVKRSTKITYNYSVICLGCSKTQISL